MEISAIIPVYNGKRYLRQAVESVIRQTLQPIELIVVDDGSTEDSLSAIEGIHANFPIRVITKENGGQSSARNCGARESRGSFLALLDQDDIWYERHLEKLAEPFYGNFDLGWVYSNVDQITDTGYVFFADLLDRCGFSHPQSELSEMLRKDMHILPAATLIRKEAFMDVGMFDERLSGYEDDDLFLRLFVRGWRRKYLPDSLSQWRIHAHNSGIVTGFKSRRIYIQKMIDMFSSSSAFASYSPAEILGVRFFNVTLHFYYEALKAKDYATSISLFDDLTYYAGFAPRDFQKKWKYKLNIMKNPKLYRKARYIKGLLLKAGICRKIGRGKCDDSGS
jgi:glycosyltransferase involved in cell wall biosynthesis